MAASRRSGSRFETDFKDHLDVRGLTFEDLKGHQCPDSVLLKLSKGLDNWDIVGLYLEITLPEIKAIKVDNDSEESRRFALLNKWKQKNGDNATYYNLVFGLLDAERIDIADQALDYLKENIIEIRRQQKTAWQEEEERQREERRQQEIQLEYEMKEKGTVKVESQASEAEAKQVTEEAKQVIEEAKQVTEEAYKKQWDEYYMRIACLAALKSKISTPVGACIVDNKSRIVGFGYNSIPLVEGEDSDEAHKKNKKGNEFIGAAVNAIIYKTRELDGCTIYLTSYPDEKSAHAILVARIKEVVYCMYTRKEGREKELDMEKIGKIFKANNIETREMTMSNEEGVAKILHNRIKESKALEQVERPEQLDASSGPHGTITWEEFFMGIAILSTRTPRPHDRNPKLADTAGSERYESMSRIYYRGAKSAIVCFDEDSSVALRLEQPPMNREKCKC
uniref:dCMP deaminase n=1 Tax=Amphimedon queenslandica TaxID=400682 RepID=A0A1X7UTN9_AMPQE